MANSSSRKVVVTGITGQTGSYLADLLLEQGCEVHGIVRRSSSFSRSRIEHLRSDPNVYGTKLFLHYSDLSDFTTIRRLLNHIEPEEIYHLAGQSHVGLSFEIPESTCNEIANATLAILEICRDLATPPRVFHASSSEVFGVPDEVPQNETTAFWPATPYGCAKAFATNIASVYRRSHGLFICNGILYNHESPRRAANFVTKKIVMAAAAHSRGSLDCLELGNLSSARDWGYAKEYAQAMLAMLQHEIPDDYVIATGVSTTVRDFAASAYSAVGINLGFEGSGLSEVGFDRLSGRIYVKVNPRFYRPFDPCQLIGDPFKAGEVINWQPKVMALDLAKLMVEAELNSLVI